MDSWNALPTRVHIHIIIVIHVHVHVYNNYIIMKFATVPGSDGEYCG